MCKHVARGTCECTTTQNRIGPQYANSCPATGLCVIAIDPIHIAPDFSTRLAAQLDRLSTEYGVHVPGRSKAASRNADKPILEISDKLIARLERLAR